MRGKSLYDGGLVRLDEAGVTLLRHYFPFGTSKRIWYRKIHGYVDRKMTMLSGQIRLWGTGGLGTAAKALRVRLVTADARLGASPGVRCAIEVRAS